jgi:hypothetical protein
MASLTMLFQLALGGLLLDQRAFQAQRNAPDGFSRGALLVVLIGLLVGIAGWVGNLGVYLTQPDADAVRDTLYDGLVRLPLYQNLLADRPELGFAIEQAFSQSQGGGLLAAGPLQSALNLIFSPVLALLGWLLIGSIVHVVARAFGGTASFSQTLACTALVSGTSLLMLVQIVPYAQVAGTTTLGLIATYVAVRESHGLPAWRSFWAVMLGPLLLAVLLGGFFCCVFFLLVSAAGGA